MCPASLTLRDVSPTLPTYVCLCGQLHWVESVVALHHLLPFDDVPVPSAHDLQHNPAYTMGSRRGGQAPPQSREPREQGGPPASGAESSSSPSHIAGGEGGSSAAANFYCRFELSNYRRIEICGMFAS